MAPRRRHNGRRGLTRRRRPQRVNTVSAACPLALSPAAVAASASPRYGGSALRYTTRCSVLGLDCRGMGGVTSDGRTGLREGPRPHGRAAGGRSNRRETAFGTGRGRERRSYRREDGRDTDPDQRAGIRHGRRARSRRRLGRCTHPALHASSPAAPPQRHDTSYSRHTDG